MALAAAATGYKVVLPLVAQFLASGFGSGLSSYQASRENRRQGQLANIRRQELQPVIDRLTQARDYFQMEEQLVRNFTRAADQMGAQSAQTGMTNAGSGGLDHQRRDVLGSMLAELSQVQANDELQRTQMLAAILSDPSLYEGQVPGGSVAGDTLLGGVAGGFGGLAQMLGSFISTREGLEALGGLFNRGDQGPVKGEGRGDGAAIGQSFMDILMGLRSLQGGRNTGAGVSRLGPLGSLAVPPVRLPGNAGWVE